MGKKSRGNGTKGGKAECAKVQVMSSWTRTSADAVGTMGAGFAFISGREGNGHVPMQPGTTSHTQALFLAVAEILSKVPSKADLEVEITHRMLVETFNHFGSAAEEVSKAVAFIRHILADGQAVNCSAIDAFASRLIARSGRTYFSMCVDAGRYMTREMTELRPPGEVAAKRVEALERGAFLIHRAVGRDMRMSDENDDLLEVRWVGLFDQRGYVFLDRFRDMTLDEAWALIAWGAALSRECGGEADGPDSLWSPLRLANEDPGIFWSCVRHNAMTGWPNALLEGRERSWRMRDRLAKEHDCCCDFEFPAEKRGLVATMALVEVQKQCDRMPGFKKGMNIIIMGNASEKGNPNDGEYEQFMKMMEAMQGMPSNKREKILAQLEKEQDRENQKEKKRKEREEPRANMQLTGQSLCCWSCGNCEQAHRPLQQCPLCAGHLCLSYACAFQHRSHCLSREPEAEDSISHGGAVECVVLPGDQSIKPYQRMLPRRVAAANKMLAEVLRCEKLLALAPHRGFQRDGSCDSFEDGWQMSRHELFLVQADWASSLSGATVEISGLTSTSGKRLNGHRGTLGSYHGDRDRWEVTCGPGQPKLLKGFNLIGYDATLRLARQNLRASTILTPLFDNFVFGDDGFAEMHGGIDNRFIFGDQEISARARGDVWVVRAYAEDFESARELLPFTFSDFERLWGIFQCMCIPFSERFAMGTTMKKDPDSENMLGNLMRSALYGDAEDASDDEDEEQSVFDRLDFWDWAAAQAEEEPEPLLGAVVQIFGLKSAQHYNGARGRVLAVAEKLQVKLFSPFDKTLKVSRDNVMIDCGQAEDGADAADESVCDSGAEESQAEPQEDFGPSAGIAAEPDEEPGLDDVTAVDQPLGASADKVAPILRVEELAGGGELATKLRTATMAAAGSESQDMHMSPQRSPDDIPVVPAVVPVSSSLLPPLSERPVGSQFFLSPCALRFSQDSVKSTFRSGGSIRETLDQLLSHEVRKRDVEMMRVVFHEGHHYTLSNRRLTLYRLLQMAGRCKRVKVELVLKGSEFWRKFSSKCQGEHIVIRDTMEVVGRDLPSTTFHHSRF